MCDAYIRLAPAVEQFSRSRVALGGCRVALGGLSGRPRVTLGGCSSDLELLLGNLGAAPGGVLAALGSLRGTFGRLRWPQGRGPKDQPEYPGQELPPGQRSDF